MSQSSELLDMEVIKSQEIRSYFSKRAFDIAFGMAGIILLIPILFFIIFLNIKNKEKNKIFFTQRRIGKNGKPIKIYKFNSMMKDAEKVLEKLMEEDEAIREEYTKNKKLENDPRVTKTGQLIRKLSLDEFPQFINVIKGEMSVVGPRPYLWSEKEDMGECFDEIIKVKPGVTGLWQVSGRNDVSFENRLKMDLEYCEKISLKEDMKIIVHTIEPLIGGNGK